MSYEDTIAAIATPPGRGGIGIVRVSGPLALKVASSFLRPRRGSVLYQQSNTIRFARVVSPDTDELIDEAMVSVMRSPNSYTAEDVVEISCHGGTVPLGRTLALALDNGARLAEPGEFTKRAFLAGRIDLTQAEAVCDLIEAKTAKSARLAVEQLSGRLSSEIRAIRQTLIHLLALIEAGIDFPEHDVPEATRETLASEVTQCKARVEALLETADTGRVFREGVRVAIVGRPNVGKSSLMNALLGQERAIVTSVAGTTRDVIEETANIKGIPFVLLDTAGLRATQDLVELIGVRRAREAQQLADLTVLVIDASEPVGAEDLAVIQEVGKGALVLVANKQDLRTTPGIAREIEQLLPGARVVLTSLISGAGVDELRKALYDVVTGGIEISAESPVVTNQRHRQHLVNARRGLREAFSALEDGVPYDIVSIDIGDALSALGNITGETVAEDILEEIFSRFCIGK